jgi:hypothetical protein
MRKNFLIGLSMGLSFLLVATTASALTMDVNITGILDSNQNPKGTIDPSGDTAVADLAVGDFIILSIDFSNPDGDLMTDVASTIVIEGLQLLSLGGAAAPKIFAFQPAGFPPPPEQSLAAIAPPAVKINTPSTGTDVWVQSSAFAGTGTIGAGPDNGAITLFFEVLAGATGFTRLDFDLVQTDGDVPFAAGGANSLLINNAVINVPEPGTLALGLASISTVGLLARVRRRR